VHEKSGLRAAFFRLVICLNHDGLYARQVGFASLKNQVSVDSIFTAFNGI
jgi:hypothetical protein